MADSPILISGLGVRFLFDSQGNVITPVRAKLGFRTSDAWGLRGVDAEVRPGEGVALIGPTGSGKTSFLRVVAGVLPADEGEIRVTGTIASMLSIDAGLLPALTGRENALLLQVLGGSSRAGAKERLDDIRERSGLGDAYERQASSYSQGMRARLGFTAATAMDPDVVLLDEVHEALDHRFRETLEETVESVLSRGGVAIATGHDHEVLSSFCSRALQMDGGHVTADGPFEEIRARYLSETSDQPGAEVAAMEGSAG